MQARDKEAGCRPIHTATVAYFYLGANSHIVIVFTVHGVLFYAKLQVE